MNYLCNMKYYFAPVQGHTDAAYRHFHALRYGCEDVIYTTPFIRLEKGEIRKKDLKDVCSNLNEGQSVVPQVIFRDRSELETLVDILKAEGVSRIDINMGCPFPLQTSHGRGAATVANEACRRAVTDIVTANPDLVFSVKMRLGYKEEEWKELLQDLNTIPLDHIAVHPRTAKDQYSGPLSMDSFEAIYRESKNPVVYNGDIRTPEDAIKIAEQYPRLAGIMIGRGALARPSIFKEIMAGNEIDAAERLRQMKNFHRDLITHYTESLIGGEHQVLSKIQPFWEYAEDEIGRKAWKAIKKASTMAKYQTALALI